MENKQVKFGLKSYWKSTPTKIRKAADTIMGIAGTTGIQQFATGNSKSAFLISIGGIFLKYVSNFFGEIEAKIKEQEEQEKKEDGKEGSL